MIRRFIALIFVPIVFGYSFGGVVSGCAALADIDQKQVHDDSFTIVRCQIAGMNCRDRSDAGPGADAGCYAVYTDCMTDGGLK